MSSEIHPPVDHTVRDTVADVAATFGGVVLITTALMDILQGAAAINDPDFFAAGSEYLFELNVTAWGWIHVIVGVVSAVVAIGIFGRRSWAQVLGLIVVALGMLTSFAWLPYAPVWAIVLIALRGFVLWALSVQVRNYR